MKIELDVTTTTKAEFEVELPYYLQEGNTYYCFFNPIDLKKSIILTDYGISKGIDYSLEFKSLNSVLQKENSARITKEVFQNKLVEILNIINGAVDEMHKADEQQKDS